MPLQFHDTHPVFADFHQCVIEGFSSKPKRLAPKFFYDEAGSKIFDAICAQPEYYIPAIEHSIYEKHARDMLASLGSQKCHWIEPGAGSSFKVRKFLEIAQPAMYVPMDISAEHLRASAERLTQDYPDLTVHAVCVDHTQPYTLPAHIPGRLH